MVQHHDLVRLITRGEWALPVNLKSEGRGIVFSLNSRALPQRRADESIRTVLLAGRCSPGGALAAAAAGFLTNGLPVAGGAQFPSTLPLTGNETLQRMQSPQGTGLHWSEAVTLSQVGSYSAGVLCGFVPDVLVGGDAATDLWQRGTTGSSVDDCHLRWSGSLGVLV